VTRAEDGGRLWTAETGGGAPLILCHGGPVGADAVRHAEEMATPWFGVNWECHREIWGEPQRTWREADLVAECHALSVRVLIIDGAADLRPRWAVGSPEQALPL
jgi:proline iminopeptidase